MASEVDAYIALQPRAAQAVLKRVRAIILKALPGAEEAISYKIPAYRVGGRVVVYFAGWKEHYSLYPVTAPIVAALGGQLDGYELRKGTLRLPLDEPVPVRLVTRVVKALGAAAAARAAARPYIRKR